MIIIMIIIITKTIISLTLIIMLIIMTITIITTIIIITFLINVLQLKRNILITSIKLIKLKILLMILMLLLDVKNLIIIIIIITMKSIVATKTALSIKIMSPPHHYRKTVKETVFILGDSMVKKFNGFLLARKLNYKCLVKVRPFSLVKVRCMHDHVKTTVINFNPDRIILHCGTNDLNSEQTASQIARSIIELALSLKSKDNKISVSLIVPTNDNLNNKASEVDCRLVHMCAERNIPYIDHTNSIQPENHLNKSKLHFNRYGTIAFANSISKFLSKYY